MTVSGVLGRGNIAGLEVALTVPEEVYDELPAPIAIRLENRKRFFGAFLIRVALPGGSVLFTAVGRRSSATAVLPLTFAGRGTRSLTGMQILSAFPVNFFVRRTAAAGSRQITVFPAPRRCPAVADILWAKAGETAASGRGYEGDLSRIREYRGEPLKLIHWKLSARQDEFKVREFSAAHREPVIIDPLRLPGRDLEERLRCGSYLINHYLRESRPVGLRVGGRLISPALSRTHKLRLLTELAHYGQT